MAIMSHQANRIQRDSIARDEPHGAGLMGLRSEVAATPTEQVVDQITLLIELPPDMDSLAHWRLRYLAWALAERLTDEGSVAA